MRFAGDTVRPEDCARAPADSDCFVAARRRHCAACPRRSGRRHAQHDRDQGGVIKTPAPEFATRSVAVLLEGGRLFAASARVTPAHRRRPPVDFVSRCPTQRPALPPARHGLCPVAGSFRFAAGVRLAPAAHAQRSHQCARRVPQHIYQPPAVRPGRPAPVFRVVSRYPRFHFVVHAP